MPPGKPKSGKKIAKEKSEPVIEVPTAVLLSGSLVFANGDKYEGQYSLLEEELVERCGPGTYFFADGTQYGGDWEKDQLKGPGFVHFKSGAKYEGEFDGIKYHGEGTYTFVSGAQLKGRFKANRISGTMTFVDESGLTWTGEMSGDRLAMRLRPDIIPPNFNREQFEEEP